MDAVGLIVAHAALGALPDHDEIMLLMPVLPVLLVATILVGLALDRRGLFGPTDRRVSVATPLAVICAALSLAAAGIHFAVIQSHLEQDLAEGLFFFGLAWFQAIWAQVYLVRNLRAAAGVGVVVNTVVVLIWLVSRTVGLPFGPQPGIPEQVGLADLLATAFELALVGLLLPSIAPAWFARLTRSELPAQKAFVLAAFTIVTVALLTGLALLDGPAEAVAAL